jgi:glutaredoxin
MLPSKFVLPGMLKKTGFIVSVIAIIILVLGGYFIFKFKNSSSGNSGVIAQDNSSIIFFYGRECPHCQLVEKYIADNNLDQKVSFSKREVYHDTANANLMAEKAQVCGIKTDQLGVPFLWANGKCYEGETDVENYLNSQAKS